MCDLEEDLGETTDDSTQNPDIVNRLEELAEKVHESSMNGGEIKKLLEFTLGYEN